MLPHPEGMTRISIISLFGACTVRYSSSIAINLFSCLVDLLYIDHDSTCLITFLCVFY